MISAQKLTQNTNILVILESLFKWNDVFAVNIAKRLIGMCPPMSGIVVSIIN